jgi:hypothetical protein
MIFPQPIVSALHRCERCVFRNKMVLPVAFLFISAIAAAASLHFQQVLQKRSTMQIRTFVDHSYNFKVSYDGTLHLDLRNDRGLSLNNVRSEGIAIGVYDYGDMHNFVDSRNALIGLNGFQERRTFAHISGTMLSPATGNINGQYIDKAFYFTRGDYGFGIDIGSPANNSPALVCFGSLGG